MEDFIQFSAKTKSEAITKACIELGVSSDQLEIQVVSEGKSGLFGIGSKPAIIKVRKAEPVSEEEEIKEIVEKVKIDSLKEEKAFKEEISVKEEKNGNCRNCHNKKKYQGEFGLKLQVLVPLF